MLQGVDDGLVKIENGREKKRKRETPRIKEEQVIYDEGWSRLPYDLINEISNRLDTIEDFLAFSLVCKSWQSIYRDRTWLSSSKIPWLMLDINQNIEQCFSLYKKKTFGIPLFKAHDRRIWGSSHGWLITIDPNFSIQLLNPITRVKINLPPVATFGEPNDILKIGWFNLVHNAAVLKLGNNIFVTVIYGPSYNLAFVKLGDMAWTNVRSRLMFTSVACYKGMIFGLSVNGTLATVEIDENKQTPPIARCLVSLPMGEMCGQKLYLSEASDDLLLVCYHPKRMSVYRCDFISWEWKNVESLGDRVLFLDEHSCLSMCSRVCTKNLEADCIYYSHDNFESWTDIDNFQSWTDIDNYIRVYNLKSKNWKTFFLGACVFFRYRSPTWLFPSLSTSFGSSCSTGNSVDKNNKLTMTTLKKLTDRNTIESGRQPF